MKNKLKFKTLARQTGSFKAEGNDLMLYGVIGDYFDELSAQKIVNHIKSMSGHIVVSINSPGGDVFDGIAIMNALKDYSKSGKGKIKVVVYWLESNNPIEFWNIYSTSIAIAIQRCNGGNVSG